MQMSGEDFVQNRAIRERKTQFLYDRSKLALCKITQVARY